MAKLEINALEIVFNHLYCGGVVETNDSQWLGMDTDGNMNLYFKINEDESRKVNIPSMTVQELAELSKALPDDLLLEYSCTKPTKELLDKNLLQELEVISLEMGENLKQSRN